MNRRELLELSTAGALLSVSASASGGHAQHDSASGHGALIDAASRCVTTGEACLSHCLVMLGKGTTELAECAIAVRDTIAACAALRELASANSPHTKALARVVRDICRDCEQACRKHRQHEVCRECEQACKECAERCG